MKVYIAAFVACMAFGLSLKVYLMDRTETVTHNNQVAAALIEANTPGALEPAAVFAIASANDIEDRVDFLIKVFEIPGFLVQPLKEQLHSAMKAVDPTRPIGAFGYCDEDKDAPDVIACIPVTDVEVFKSTVAELGLTFGECEWGTTVEIPGDGTYLIKEVDGYLFVAKEKTLIENLPEGATDIFSSLVQSDLIGFRVSAQSVPDVWKNKCWEGMKVAINNAQVDLNNTPSVDRVKDMIFGTDQFEVRLGINKEGQKIQLRSFVTGVEGSLIANDSKKESGKERTRFSGFQFDKSAVNFLMCSNTVTDELKEIRALANEKIEEVSGMMDLSEGEQVFVELLDSILDSGRIDVGLTIAMKGGKPNVAFGLAVPDESLVMNAIDKLQANKKPDAPGMERDFAKYGMITLHRFSGGKPDAEVSNMFGEDLEGYLGIGDGAVYFSMGANSLELLKRCIDKSLEPAESDNVVVRGQVRMLTLMRSAFGDELLSQDIGKWRGLDRMTFESSTCENGYTGNVDIELGTIVSAMTIPQMLAQKANAEFETLSRELNVPGGNQPMGGQKGMMVPIQSGDDATKIPFSKMEKTY